MTPRTTDLNPHESATNDIELFVDGVELKSFLISIHSKNMRKRQLAGGNELLSSLSGIGGIQEISCKLLLYEVIPWFVCVETVDRPQKQKRLPPSLRECLRA